MYAPPSVLVDEDYQILHLSNGATRYLRFVPGEPTANLLRVIVPELRLEVSTALYAATAEGREQVRVGAAPAAAAAAAARVTVRPVREPESVRGYLLVLFEEVAAAPAGTAAVRPGRRRPGRFRRGSGPADAELLHQLEGQVDRLHTQLRGTIEQYEASLEQLKASNEELQAMNEELRSAGEELETSKEELQSVNEELSTVNQELKARVDEISRTNADLQNLLAATDIATIFVDRGLHVKRYTPAVESLFNLIPTDVAGPSPTSPTGSTTTRWPGTPTACCAGSPRSSGRWRARTAGTSSPACCPTAPPTTGSTAWC
jgi:two-component system CheB/CheR fusion protein